MKKIFLFLLLLSCSYLVFAQSNKEEELTRVHTRNEQYINSLLQTKQYPEAEKAIKKLIKQYPETAKYKLAQARLYKEQGQLAEAAKVYEQLISTLPKEESEIRAIANDLYQMQEYDVAATVFLQGRKLLGNEQIFTFELLSLYRFKKDKNNLILEFLNALSTMPQMLPQAETVLAALFENNADYLNLQNALFKRMQKDPQNESYAKLLIWQFLQQQEYEMALRQLIAQDKRTKDNGRILFENAQIFTANKAYETAIKAYTYLLTKGRDNEYFLSARLGLADAKYQLLLSGKNDQAEITVLANEYRTILEEYGQNRNTLFALRKLASIEAYYLHHLQKATETLETALKITDLSASETGELKLELADLYVLSQEPWEALLRYGQVAEKFENQTIGNEAKFRSARLSFYQGNFTYAKSQLDVLKASTEQLIANDAMDLSLLLTDHLETAKDTLALKMYAAAEWMQFRGLSKPAMAKLDSITVLYPENMLHDEILMSKSKIYIQDKAYTEAVPLLKQLIANPQTNNLTDDAVFLLAGLYEDQLNDPEQAKILYQKLITEFPGSMFTAEARKHYRKLRGDNIKS